MFGVKVESNNNDSLKEYYRRICNIDRTKHFAAAEFPNIISDLNSVSIVLPKRVWNTHWVELSSTCKIEIVPELAYLEVFVATYRNMVETTYNLTSVIKEDSCDV